MSGVRPLTTIDEESVEPCTGLALPRESGRRVKERRKPGRWWPNHETGGGFPQIGDFSPGSTHRWKALWAGKVVSLDGGPMAAVLAPRGGPVRPDPAGRDRERQRSSTSHELGRKRRVMAAQRWHRRARVPRLRSGSTSVVGATEAGRHAVKRGSNRGRIAARWYGVARENPISVGEGSGGHGVASSSPGIERSTGSRVVSRLAEVGSKRLPHVVEASREATETA
jgi:hypothetical protein